MAHWYEENEVRHCRVLSDVLPGCVTVEHHGGSRSDVADIKLMNASNGMSVFCESKPGISARCGQATFVPSGKGRAGFESIAWDGNGMPIPSHPNAYTDSISEILRRHRSNPSDRNSLMISPSYDEKLHVAKSIATHYGDQFGCPAMIVGVRDGEDVLIRTDADEIASEMGIGIQRPYGKPSGSHPMGIERGPAIAEMLAEAGVPHGSLRFRPRLPVARKNKSGLVLASEALRILGWPMPSDGHSRRVRFGNAEFILCSLAGASDFVELKSGGATSSITVHVCCWRCAGTPSHGGGMLESPGGRALLDALGIA
jgi:hypothetical protein